MKVLITGANGFIAKNLKFVFSAPQEAKNSGNNATVKMSIGPRTN